MSERVRNYLDNAATSWPKPETVYAAMDGYAREIGAAAGRGDYQSAAIASDIVNQCRLRLMRLINAETSSQIALLSNGTAALNAAIFGVVRNGDHVITSAIEHNSVLRPLDELSRDGRIRLDIVPCDGKGNVDVAQMLDRIDDRTSLVALSHASNVTGAVQDINAIGERIRDTKTLFLCDAAQSLGYLPIDVKASGIDLLAAPGHKGACGPLGTGMLYVSRKALLRMKPTVFGGTGSVSQSLQMPTSMPEMLEAGNLNVPAIAGWNAGLEWFLSQDATAHRSSIASLCKAFNDRFSEFQFGIAIVGKELPIVSLLVGGGQTGLISTLLGSECNIDARFGLHCAAMIHESIRTSLGIKESDYHGTLRLSAGHFTRLLQITDAGMAIDRLCEELGIKP